MSSGSNSDVDLVDVINVIMDRLVGCCVQIVLLIYIGVGTRDVC